MLNSFLINRHPSSSTVASVETKRASLPFLLSSSTKSLPLFPKFATTTLAPYSANKSTVAFPIPLAPPVTMATLFSSLFIFKTPLIKFVIQQFALLYIFHVKSMVKTLSKHFPE